MGFLSDFVDGVGDFVGNTVDAVGDAGQWIGDKVGNDWQQTYNNLDNYWKTGVDMVGDTGQMVGDITRNATSDPLDINSYTDPAQRKLDNFNEQGDDIFGTGGWIKAGANVATTGNPFYGAGSTGYQLDAAASGSDYNNGRTSGIADAVGLYNLGSNISNSVSNGSSLPTDSNTYQEALPGGGSTTVTPSDFYSGSNSLSNLATVTQGGSQMGDVSVYGGNPSDTLYTPDLGNYGSNPSLPNMDYDQSYGVGNSPYVTGSAPPGYMDQARDFLNSTPGKVVRAGASIVNPTLGSVLNGTTTGLNGDMGRAAFDTLGSIYMNNRAAKANRQYQDQMNNMMGSMSNLYSQNSPYAQQLRQELERKDAASGRRSQYGGRETQLQAMLAEKQAGLAPMQNILTSQAMQGSIAQQQAARNRQIADLKSIFMPQKPGGQSQGSGAGILQGGWDKVKELWGSF